MLCGVQQTSKWSRARCLPFVAVRHLQRCERCQQGQWSPNTNEDARRGSKGGTGPRIWRILHVVASRSSVLGLVSAVSPVGTSADTGKQCEARTVSEAATRLTHGGEDRRCERRYVLDVVNSATMYSSARDHATFSPWAYAIDNAQSFEGWQ